MLSRLLVEFQPDSCPNTTWRLACQGKNLQNPPGDEICHDGEKPEAGEQKCCKATHEQAADQEIGNRRSIHRCKKKAYENECDRRRPVLAQQDPEKNQKK